jgi:hypothetical protein
VLSDINSTPDVSSEGAGVELATGAAAIAVDMVGLGVTCFEGAMRRFLLSGIG